MRHLTWDFSSSRKWPDFEKGLKRFLLNARCLLSKGGRLQALRINPVKDDKNSFTAEGRN